MLLIILQPCKNRCQTSTAPCKVSHAHAHVIVLTALDQLRTPEQGADTVVWLCVKAVLDKAWSGQFFEGGADTMTFGDCDDDFMQIVTW